MTDRIADTYGTPPGDPMGDLFTFLIAATFLLAGALAATTGSLGSLVQATAR